MAKALSYPAFNDVTIPEVSEMILQLKKCQRMINGVTVSNASKTADAIDELWVKINAAEVTAKRIAWSKISKEEQKDMRIALDLAKQVNDRGNPDEMRLNLYARLKRVVDRLNRNGVTIPDKMVAQIHHNARLEIEQKSDVVEVLSQ